MNTLPLVDDLIGMSALGGGKSDFFSHIVVKHYSLIPFLSPGVISHSLLVGLFSCIHYQGKDSYVLGISEHTLNYSPCTKMPKTKSMKDPVTFN